MGALLYSSEAGVCFRVCGPWTGLGTPGIPLSLPSSVGFAGTLGPTLGFYMGTVNLNAGAYALPFEPSPQALIFVLFCYFGPLYYPRCS